MSTIVIVIGHSKIIIFNHNRMDQYLIFTLIVIVAIIIIGMFYFMGKDDTIPKEVSKASSSSGGSVYKTTDLTTCGQYLGVSSEGMDPKASGDIKIALISDTTMGMSAKLNSIDDKGGKLVLDVNAGCINYTKTGDTIKATSLVQTDEVMFNGQKKKIDENNKRPVDFKAFDLKVGDGGDALYTGDGKCKMTKVSNEKAPSECPLPGLNCITM